MFTESASGRSTRQRDQLAAALDYMNAGDTLVVWRLYRLGRNVVDLVQLVEGLADRGVEFRSLTCQKALLSHSGGTCVPLELALASTLARRPVNARCYALSRRPGFGDGGMP